MGHHHHHAHPAAQGGDALAQHIESAAIDPASRAKVHLKTDGAVDQWAGALGLTPEALESAVQAVGPRVDKIKDYLTIGMAGEQEDA